MLTQASCYETVDHSVSVRCWPHLNGGARFTDRKTSRLTPEKRAFWDKSQSDAAALLRCKDEVFFLAIVRWDTQSSVDVWSSEMSHFEKQQKSTSFSALPLLPPTGSLFSFLSVSVCVCVSLSLSFLGTCGVGNVLERERGREGGLECWTCSTCRLESWSRVRPTAHTRGEEGRTDGLNTRIGEKNRAPKTEPSYRQIHILQDTVAICGEAN